MSPGRTPHWFPPSRRGRRAFATIEGWSSWRVSSMGLLNVGKGEGSQIIQLFGRGVRLKGKEMSLKRSAALRDGTPPEGISFLETLTIFGWNANYIQTFRAILENEDLGKEFTLPVRKMDPWSEGKLPVPQKEAGFDPSTLTWTLDAGGPRVELDLTPRLAALASAGQHMGAQQATGRAAGTVTIDFSRPPYDCALDWEALYLEALDYRQMRGYANLYVSAQAVEQVARAHCRVILLRKDIHPERLQQAAARALKTYMDRFVRMKEREAESRKVEVGCLAATDQRMLEEYRIRIKRGQLVEQIEKLLKSGVPAWDDGEPLPRLYFDRSLFNPILGEGGRQWKQTVSVHPPALNRDERQFLRDLREFWKASHGDPEFRDCELYVLRNLARSGVGLFHRSGFCPDFILWLRNKQTAATRVMFVDPHGLHHDGLEGSADKFAALNALRKLSDEAQSKDAAIRLDGFLLTSTRISEIVDAKGRSQAELEQEYPLVFQQGDYVSRMLGEGC